MDRRSYGAGMTKGMRGVLAVLIAFVVARLAIELIGWPAIFIGVIVGFIAWQLLPKPATKG